MKKKEERNRKVIFKTRPRSEKISKRREEKGVGKKSPSSRERKKKGQETEKKERKDNREKRVFRLGRVGENVTLLVTTLCYSALYHSDCTALCYTDYNANASQAVSLANYGHPIGHPSKKIETETSTEPLGARGDVDIDVDADRDRQRDRQTDRER